MKTIKFIFLGMIVLLFLSAWSQSNDDNNKTDVKKDYIRLLPEEFPFF